MTHYRSYSRRTAGRRRGDPDHVAGGERWNAARSRVLMRFMGPPTHPTHLTKAEAQELLRRPAWRRGADQGQGAAATVVRASLKPLGAGANGD